MGRLLTIRIILIFSFIFFDNLRLPAQLQKELQKEIDSLIKLISFQKDDGTKAEIMTLVIAQKKTAIAQLTGGWDEPIEWYHTTLQFSEKINYTKGITRSYWGIGLCWMNKANYPEAVKYFLEGVNASYKYHNKNALIACNTKLVDCYLDMGDYGQALRTSLYSLDTLAHMDPNREQEIIWKEWLMMRVAISNAKLHNYTEALQWYEKLLKLNDRISIKEDEIRIGIANINAEMKNYDTALKNYKAALQIMIAYPTQKDREENDYTGSLGVTYEKIGETYYKVGMIQKNDESINSFREAINYLNKSLPLLKGNAGGKEALMNAYLLLKQACEAVNDYQNALQYNNLYTTIKDSIYNKENYMKLADLRVQYETEKAASELKNKQALEKAHNEKLLADQELIQQKILAKQKNESDSALNEQKIEKVKAIELEKANSVKNLAVEKAAQEKLRVEKQQANNLLLLGLVSVTIISLFLSLYLRQLQLKKRAEERTQSIHRMAELEMQSLRSQLNPHFMFNSLNSIQTLILKEDSDKSHAYLSTFARLLRLMLENADKPFISLQKEIDFLQLYLSLESLRVPDLQYSISIAPSLQTGQLLIPNMILQPYVENAIWHGLSYKESDKQLQIRINSDNGTVNYEIEDNGVGRKKAEDMKSLFRKQHQSKGMELLNKRFKLLNGEYNSEIVTMINDIIKNNEVAGTLVTIKVPIQLSHPSQN